MKVNSKELLSTLKKDFDASKDLRKELDEKIARWKREYNGEKYGNENKKKSQIVSRDIKKQSEWGHPALLEPFVSTPDIIRVNPVTFEDAEIAPKISVLLNTQFCRQFNRFTFMSKVIRVLDQEGTVVVRTGWDYEEKSIEELISEEVVNPEYQQALQFVQSGQADPQILDQIQPTIIQQRKVIKKKPIKNQPTAIVVRNEDIFIDPTCMDDFDKAQFVIHRYETDMSTLRQSGEYTNLDKVQMDLDQKDNDFSPYNNTSFTFKDNPRKKLVIHEYWGNYDIDGDGITEPIVCCWIGDTIVKLTMNPYPDKKPPFIVAPFNVIPFSLYGESNAELLSDIQKIKTAIYRGFIDNMALSNNGQKGIRQGSLDSVNQTRFLNGEHFIYNGHPNDFYDGHFNELPGSIFNILQLMSSEAESITGVASFNSGINGNALGGTSTAIKSAVDSASSRRLNIVRNISENLVKPLLRKWLAYDAVFLDEESQFRITNDDFIWLKRDDLGANIDIDIAISTSDDNQSKASELAFMLQTIGPSEDPNIRKMLMSEIAELYRMPHLAKAIKEYQPQPDPLQQRQAELQLQLLEAEVNRTNAKAGEDTIDQELKSAKVQTELAKAQNLQSNADRTDINALQDYYGVKDKNKLAQEEKKEEFKVNRELLKLLGNGNKNYL